MSSISDFIRFSNPIIYAGTQDSDSANDFQSFLSTVYFLDVPIIAPPTDFTGITTLDQFLNGNDIFLIGGPIANSASLFFQNNLQAALTGAGLQSLSFSTGDGTNFGNNAPLVNIGDNSNSFTLSRTDDPPGSITDTAIILMLQGTTNSLIYIAGIRDLGTATALFMLKWATLDPSLWPNKYGDVSTLTDWQTVFSSNNTVIVDFTISQNQNSLNLAEYINQIQNNGLV